MIANYHPRHFSPEMCFEGVVEANSITIAEQLDNVVLADIVASAPRETDSEPYKSFDTARVVMDNGWWT